MQYKIRKYFPYKSISNEITNSIGSNYTNSKLQLINSEISEKCCKFCFKDLIINKDFLIETLKKKTIKIKVS